VEDTSQLVSHIQNFLDRSLEAAALYMVCSIAYPSSVGASPIFIASSKTNGILINYDCNRE
jgi:hypothetical protein